MEEKPKAESRNLTAPSGPTQPVNITSCQNAINAPPEAVNHSMMLEAPRLLTSGQVKEKYGNFVLKDQLPSPKPKGKRKLEIENFHQTKKLKTTHATDWVPQRSKVIVQTIHAEASTSGGNCMGSFLQDLVVDIGKAPAKCSTLKQPSLSTETAYQVSQSATTSANPASQSVANVTESTRTFKASSTSNKSLRNGDSQRKMPSVSSVADFLENDILEKGLEVLEFLDNNSLTVLVAKVMDVTNKLYGDYLERELNQYLGPQSYRKIAECGPTTFAEFLQQQHSEKLDNPCNSNLQQTGDKDSNALVRAVRSASTVARPHFFDPWTYKLVKTSKSPACESGESSDLKVELRDALLTEADISIADRIQTLQELGVPEEKPEEQKHLVSELCEGTAKEGVKQLRTSTTAFPPNMRQIKEATVQQIKSSLFKPQITITPSASFCKLVHSDSTSTNPTEQAAKSQQANKMPEKAEHVLMSNIQKSFSITEDAQKEKLARLLDRIKAEPAVEEKENSTELKKRANTSQKISLREECRGNEGKISQIVELLPLIKPEVAATNKTTNSNTVKLENVMEKKKSDETPLEHLMDAAKLVKAELEEDQVEAKRKNEKAALSIAKKEGELIENISNGARPFEQGSQLLSKRPTTDRPKQVHIQTPTKFGNQKQPLLKVKTPNLERSASQYCIVSNKNVVKTKHFAKGSVVGKSEPACANVKASIISVKKVTDKNVESKNESCRALANKMYTNRKLSIVRTFNKVVSPGNGITSLSVRGPDSQLSVIKINHAKESSTVPIRTASIKNTQSVINDKDSRAHKKELSKSSGIPGKISVEQQSKPESKAQIKKCNKSHNRHSPDLEQSMAHLEHLLNSTSPDAGKISSDTISNEDFELFSQKDTFKIDCTSRNLRIDEKEEASVDVNKSILDLTELLLEFQEKPVIAGGNWKLYKGSENETHCSPIETEQSKKCVEENVASKGNIEKMDRSQCALASTNLAVVTGRDHNEVKLKDSETENSYTRSTNIDSFGKKKGVLVSEKSENVRQEKMVTAEDSFDNKACVPTLGNVNDSNKENFVTAIDSIGSKKRAQAEKSKKLGSGNIDISNHNSSVGKVTTDLTLTEVKNLNKDNSDTTVYNVTETKCLQIKIDFENADKGNTDTADEQIEENINEVYEKNEGEIEKVTNSICSSASQCTSERAVSHEDQCKMVQCGSTCSDRTSVTENLTKKFISIKRANNDKLFTTKLRIQHRASSRQSIYLKTRILKASRTIQKRIGEVVRISNRSFNNKTLKQRLNVLYKIFRLINDDLLVLQPHVFHSRERKSSIVSGKKQPEVRREAGSKNEELFLNKGVENEAPDSFSFPIPQSEMKVIHFDDAVQKEIKICDGGCTKLSKHESLMGHTSDSHISVEDSKNKPIDVSYKSLNSVSTDTNDIIHCFFYDKHELPIEDDQLKLEQINRSGSDSAGVIKDNPEELLALEQSLDDSSTSLKSVEDDPNNRIKGEDSTSQETPKKPKSPPPKPEQSRYFLRKRGNSLPYTLR